jgi:DNA-binding NarL/FixJ family response regulator
VEPEKGNQMTGTYDTAQRPVILLIEGRPVMRGMLREMVQNVFPGYAIVEAPNGARGMNLCATHRPRLVITDARLPDGDGIELTARIKGIMAVTAVIVISYLSGDAYVAQALAAGAHAYVVMDRLLPDLIPAISDVLGEPPTQHTGWGLR